MINYNTYDQIQLKLANQIGFKLRKQIKIKQFSYKMMVMARHFIIQNGNLIEKDHVNQFTNMNFRNIPYIHNIRFLYNNHLYETIKALHQKNQQLAIEKQQNQQMYQAQIMKLNKLLNQKEQGIRVRDIEIERLMQELRSYTKSTRSLIPYPDSRKLFISQIEDNSHLKMESLPSTKRSYLSTSHFFNFFDEGIHDNLIKIVNKSQRILDDMSNTVKKKPQRSNWQGLRLKYSGIQSELPQTSQIKSNLNSVFKSQINEGHFWEQLESKTVINEENNDQIQVILNSNRIHQSYQQSIQQYKNELKEEREKNRMLMLANQILQTQSKANKRFNMFSHRH